MKLPKLENQLNPLVGKTAKMQRLFIVDRLRAANFDITIEQWFLLAKLSGEDGQNQNDLALITDRNKGSLTRLVNSLEKNNLVARIPSNEDKRVNQIFLTKTGQVFFKKTIPIVNKAFADLQNGISKKEQEVVAKVLLKIQSNIQNAAI